MQKLLTTDDVTDHLKISKSTLWRWIRNGEFPKPIKLGKGKRGRVVWPESTIEKWIKDVVKRGEK